MMMSHPSGSQDINLALPRMTRGIAAHRERERRRGIYSPLDLEEEGDEDLITPPTTMTLLDIACH